METAGQSASHVGKTIRRVAVPVAFVGLGIAIANGAAAASADTGGAKAPSSASSAKQGKAGPARRPVVTTNAQRVAPKTPSRAGLLSLPTAPPPGVLAALALIRRELEESLVSRAPVTHPSQLGESTGPGAVISGTLDAYDQARDNLTYRVVTAPTRGTVEIDPNGTYEYTPNPDALEANDDTKLLTDRFTVAVDNGRRSLCQIDNTGLLHLSLFSRTGQTVVPVTVSVDETLTEPAPTAPAAKAFAAQALSPFTYRFTITNLTHHVVTFTGYRNDFAYEGNPDAGVTLRPGEAISFAMPWIPGVPAAQTANFTAGAAGGTFEVDMMTAPTFVGAPQVRCTAKRSRSSCTSETFTATNQVFLLDPPGTKITVPADRAQEQSDLLNGLCGSFGSSCNFRPRGNPVAGFTNPSIAQGFSPVINVGGQNTTTTYTVSEAVAKATSWSVSSTQKLNLFDKVVELSLTQTYGQTVTNTFTFSQAVAVTVASGHTAYIFVATPVLRYYGDWTMVAGNTTWDLKDVWVNTPNPLGNGIFVTVDCATGSQACADLAAGIPPSGIFPPALPGTPAVTPRPAAGTKSKVAV